MRTAFLNIDSTAEMLPGHVAGEAISFFRPAEGWSARPPDTEDWSVRQVQLELLGPWRNDEQLVRLLEASRLYVGDMNDEWFSCPADHALLRASSARIAQIEARLTRLEEKQEGPLPRSFQRDPRIGVTVLFVIRAGALFRCELRLGAKVPFPVKARVLFKGTRHLHGR